MENENYRWNYSSNGRAQHKAGSSGIGCSFFERVADKDRYRGQKNSEAWIKIRSSVRPVPRRFFLD